MKKEHNVKISEECLCLFFVTVKQSLLSADMLNLNQKEELKRLAEDFLKTYGEKK